MRIGILGGTFDPVHEGHLALARAALSQLRLDRVLFVPAFRHPLEQKERTTVASPEVRFEMTRLAVQGEPRFEVSDCELMRKGISYTVDTLKELRRQYPKSTELFFITGGDWGKNLSQWKDIETVLTLTNFVVAKRPGFDTANLPKGVKPLDFVPLEISSTDIRSRFHTGKSVALLIPKVVLDYIVKHKIYSS